MPPHCQHRADVIFAYADAVFLILPGQGNVLVFARPGAVSGCGITKLTRCLVAGRQLFSDRARLSRFANVIERRKPFLSAVT